MKKILQWIGIGTLALLVVSGVWAFLGFNQAGKLSPSVEQFVDRFYIHMNSGRYHEIYDGMSTEEFRRSVGYPKFEKFERGITEKLGKVTQRTKGPWRIFRGTGGLFFSVRYATVRERGKATEDFNLKREGDVWKIYGYNVNSAELL